MDQVGRWRQLMGGVFQTERRQSSVSTAMLLAVACVPARLYFHSRFPIHAAISEPRRSCDWHLLDGTTVYAPSRCSGKCSHRPGAYPLPAPGPGLHSRSASRARHLLRRSDCGRRVHQLTTAGRRAGRARTRVSDCICSCGVGRQSVCGVVARVLAQQTIEAVPLTHGAIVGVPSRASNGAGDTGGRAHRPG